MGAAQGDLAGREIVEQGPCALYVREVEFACLSLAQREGFHIAVKLATTCPVLLLIVALLGAAPAAKSLTRNQESREQTDFGVEDAFQKPVPLPAGALQALRTLKSSDDLLQECSEQEGLEPSAIPASWFVASKIRLTRKPASGLIVRGEYLCLGGAHITQFWVLAKSATGYKIVFRGRADALSVLPNRTDGYRDLQLVIITQAGRYVDYVTFHFAKGMYVLSGHRVEHHC